MAQQYIRSATLTLILKNGNIHNFDGLRVSFQIQKTSTSTPNPAVISLYNLSKNSFSLFEESGAKIILRVGYSGPVGTQSLKVLFKGDVAFASTSKQGTDIVTKIEAGDGEVAISESIINKTFAGGQKVSTIIDTLTGNLGVTVGAKNDIDKSKVKNITSLTLSGSTKEILDKILASEGLEWSVQNDQIFIYNPESKRNTSESRVVLTKSTGLLELAKGKESLITFKALLNPDVFPTTLVKIQEEFNGVEGFFKIRTANYVGDTHQGDWTMTCEAIKNV